MRSARAADYRRRAYQRHYAYQVTRVSFEGVPSIGTGELNLGPGPSFLCGGNGVGKSSLLHGIYLCLAGDARALPAGALRRLNGGRFWCEVETEQGMQTAEALVEDLKVQSIRRVDDLNVYYLDAGPRCYRWLDLLSSMANVDELLESVEPSESNADELAELRYLTGKPYDHRVLFEIEEFEDTLPYIKVRAGGAEYAFEDMGLGELALNILFWHITRLPRRSVLLLEEPESFVSSRSQRAWMDLLCKYTVERELEIIATTHSFGIVGGFDRKELTLIHAGTPSIGIMSSPGAHLLNAVLGVQQGMQAVLLYEDSVAKMFGTAILDQLERDLSRSVDPRIAGDASRILLALRHFPKNAIVGLVGVYDPGIPIDPSATEWPQTTLPGTHHPERELRGLFQSRAASIAELLRRPIQEVNATQAALEGYDDHDWLVELSRSLHCEVGALIDILVTVWLQDRANLSAAFTYVEAIRDALAADRQHQN